MNRWKIVFSGASVLTFFFLFFSTVIVQRGEASNIRQRSDGCGPHPLIALAAASRPFGSNGAGNLNDILRAVRADTVVWPVMQNLLRRYDDCIRAADGLHYKRSDDSVVTGSSFPSASKAVLVHLMNSPLSSVMDSRNGMKRSKGSSPDASYSEDSSNDIILPWLQTPI